MGFSLFFQGFSWSWEPCRAPGKGGSVGKLLWGRKLEFFPSQKVLKSPQKLWDWGMWKGRVGDPLELLFPKSSVAREFCCPPWEFCPLGILSPFPLPPEPSQPPNPIPSFQARNEAWNPLFLAPKIPNPPGNGRREGFHGIPAEPGPGVALGASGATQAAIFIPNLEFWPAPSPGNVFPCSKASLFAHSQPFPGFLGKKRSFLCTKIGNFGVSMAEFRVLGLFVPVGDSKIPKVLEEQGRKGPCHPFFRDEFPKIPNSQQVRAE